MFDFTEQRPQLMMLVGILLLGWILMRRQLKTRAKSRQAERQHERSVKKLVQQEKGGVALNGAPVETLRWQAELFDLQRDLKADLETKIAVVQSLLRQADRRIEELERHAGAADMQGEATQRRRDQLRAAAGFVPAPSPEDSTRSPGETGRLADTQRTERTTKENVADRLK